ncbi:MAG: 30S ribosomal protein S20 [bacterium]|nr:30S ribosomal protein S20 [bacterium]
MPITKSAQKAHRSSLRKRVFNRRRKDAMRVGIKRVRLSIVVGKREEGAAFIPAAYSAIDKAAKRGVIKKNTAARKKARLMAALHRIGPKT